MAGKSVDDPQIANLVDPLKQQTIAGMVIDMKRLAEAAEALGAEKGDVISIAGYRNSKGELVAHYGTVRIEKGAK
jgi:hypothetical protein